MWMGTLNFGLVSMPVKLYSAVSSKSVHFNQLHGTDNARIQQKRVCSADGEEVPFEEIVKGYELAPERYVVIEDAELAALAPEATRTIEIQDFVEIDEIDRIYFDQPYYVVPNRGGARSYKLLLQAMRETDKVAIARVVLRSRERLVAVHPHGDVLMMTTLNYFDEINQTSELRELSGEEEAGSSSAVGERELDVARRLVESLAEPFDIGRYKDTYREAVLDLIDRKASGEEIVVEPRPAVEALQSPDLMGALQASLEQARERGGDAATGNGKAATGNGKAKARKKALAKKPSPEKASAGKASPGEAAPGKASPGKASSEKASAGKAPAGRD
jgi:DNA end-binding protein Ku